MNTKILLDTDKGPSSTNGLGNGFMRLSSGQLTTIDVHFKIKELESRIEKLEHPQ